jgi:amphi-Trp domain-containing protein
MSEDGQFTYESLQDAGTIAKYLQSLIDGFQKGSIAMKSDEEELTLHPKGMMTFTVRAKKKAEKTKLALKMSWKDPGSSSQSFSIKA